VIDPQQSLAVVGGSDRLKQDQRDSSRQNTPHGSLSLPGRRAGRPQSDT
jgi:hypothetical protein